jgi:H+/Cl- antiporter ClcA
MNCATNKHLSFVGWLAVLAGAFFVGLVAYYFAFAGEQSEQARAFLMQRMAWIVFLLPAIGLTAITLLRVRFFQGTEGTGIPQTIASLQVEDEYQKENLLSPKILFGKILLTTVALFSGASMGREGPTVQAAACIMFYLRKLVAIPHHLAQRGLIIAGGAAGIAAAFNAPLAGIVFSIEEIGRTFDKRNLSVLIATVLVACCVCIGLFGNYWFYGDVYIQKVSNVDWALIPLVAICMGLLGGVFSHFIVRVYPQVMRVMFRRPILVPMLIGLSIGFLGWLSSGQTLGTGFLEAQGMLMHSEQSDWYYAPLRLVATALTLLSGIPGGLFDPSLSAGAGFGQWIANMAHQFEWGAGVDQKLIMMVAMACFFAGVVQSPVTAVIIMVEMTNNVHATLPMLAGALIAFAISKRICTCSIYVALASSYFSESSGVVGRRDARMD